MVADMHDGRDIVPDVYDALRKLAQARLRDLRPGQTLQATDLVHEVYIRLARTREWNHRGHFFGAAAIAMRQVLVDHARRKSALRRGGGQAVVDDGISACHPTSASGRGMSADELLAVDQALDRLEEAHPRPAQVALMRCFVGLTREQIAEALEVDPRTVDRDWRFARAWLRKALAGDAG